MRSSLWTALYFYSIFWHCYERYCRKWVQCHNVVTQLWPVYADDVSPLVKDVQNESGFTLVHIGGLVGPFIFSFTKCVARTGRDMGLCFMWYRTQCLFLVLGWMWILWAGEFLRVLIKNINGLSVLPCVCRVPTSGFSVVGECHWSR